MPPSSNLPVSEISHSIVLIRGQRVMLDSTLADLYGIETRTLVQAVVRNLGRFPEDFCFRLDSKDVQDLRSQFVMSSSGWGGRRNAPYAFTEQGIAMLSSVLRSSAAIAVNIEIMRTFVQFRRMISENRQLAERFAELERRLDKRLVAQDHAINEIMAAIRQLMKPPEPARRPIGFVTDDVKPRR